MSKESKNSENDRLMPLLDEIREIINYRTNVPLPTPLSLIKNHAAKDDELALDLIIMHDPGVVKELVNKHKLSPLLDKIREIVKHPTKSPLPLSFLVIKNNADDELALGVIKSYNPEIITSLIKKYERELVPYFYACSNAKTQLTNIVDYFSKLKNIKDSIKEAKPFQNQLDIDLTKLSIMLNSGQHKVMTPLSLIDSENKLLNNIKASLQNQLEQFGINPQVIINNTSENEKNNDLHNSLIKIDQDTLTWLNNFVMIERKELSIQELAYTTMHDQTLSILQQEVLQEKFKKALESFINGNKNSNKLKEAVEISEKITNQIITYFNLELKVLNLKGDVTELLQAPYKNKLLKEQIFLLRELIKKESEKHLPQNEISDHIRNEDATSSAEEQTPTLGGEEGLSFEW